MYLEIFVTKIKDKHKDKHKDKLYAYARAFTMMRASCVPHGGTSFTLLHFGSSRGISKFLAGIFHSVYDRTVVRV